MTMTAIRERIARGAGAARLSWDTALLGHPDCHQAAMLATVGGKAVDVLSDRRLYERFLDDWKHVPFDRRDVRGTALRVIGAALRTPGWTLRGGAFLARKLWPVRRELWRARGRTGKLTFFIQNFMDADALDEERIRNCSFMVMTDAGPVSMCEHNARRDEFILRPLALEGGAVFDPLTGRIGEASA